MPGSLVNSGAESDSGRINITCFALRSYRNAPQISESRVAANRVGLIEFAGVAVIERFFQRIGCTNALLRHVGIQAGFEQNL